MVEGIELWEHSAWVHLRCLQCLCIHLLHGMDFSSGKLDRISHDMFRLCFSVKDEETNTRTQPFLDDTSKLAQYFPNRMFLFILPSAGVVVLGTALVGFVLYHKKS